MKKTFLKNLFRDIKKTISRFLSIVVIIAVGVAFYAGVRATSPDMESSGDTYLAQHNFMDFKLMSTLGLTKNDLSEVKKQSGVSMAEGAFSIDAVYEKNEHALVLNINSIPAENGINTMKIVEGRIAKSDDEVVVEERFLKANQLKIGDEIEFKSGKDSKIEDDLKNSKFKIVGSAQSPLYLSVQRQLSPLGNGTVKGFAYILPEVFKSDVYTEIYVKTNQNESKDSLLNNADYKKTIAGMEENFKNLGIARSKVRYDEVFNTAQNKIKEAEDKLNSAKKEAANKFSDGYKQLDDAQNKITQGQAELKNNQSLYNRKMADGKKQIADGKKQLDDSQKKLDLGKQQAAGNISSAISEKVVQAKKQLDSDPKNPMYTAQYQSLNQLYENDIKGKDFDSMYNSLKMHGTLSQINTFFDIETLNSNFVNAESQIVLNRTKLADSEVQLNKAKQDGLKKLNDAKVKLTQGQKEIDQNTQKLTSEEQKANSEIKDGETEIQKNKAKLKDVKEPSWYVLGRSANVGYETYRQDSERMGNIGKAFPLIFFLVAALVSLTTMTRLVQENRTEIGTLKALGYSRTAIVSHYLIYSLAASLTGSLIAVLFAFKLFPTLIMNAYASLYTIPNSVTPFHFQLAVQASLIAVLFTTVAAMAAAAEELREAPASLMRPKPPKSGKTILLERATFIWKRLSFTKKVTARNIFRYKQRLFMTVIGIAACTGLLITGFGLKEGVIGAMQAQFNKIYKYDIQTVLNKPMNVDQQNSIRDKVMGTNNVSSMLFAYSKNGTVKDKNSGSQDVYITVPENKDELNQYIDLTMNGKQLALGDSGIIITEKLSNLINKKTGDTVEITINNKVVKAKISAVTEHYLQHYIYMSPQYYQEITGENLEYNEFYGLLKSTSESTEDAMSKTLTGISDVGSVSYRNNTYIDYNKSMDSINSVVLILIISAGVLAFVVIYNLTNINISERKRELATIKLLGFYNNELASYVYKENMILTVIGSLAGIGVGILLNSFVLNTAETNVLMFLKTLNPIYFVYSILLTVLFSVVVNLAMYQKFDKIDMIESLKSAE